MMSTHYLTAGTDTLLSQRVLAALRREMNSKAVTIRDLAARMDANPAEVTRLLVDADLTVNDADHMARALGVDLGEILWRADA